MTKGTQMETKEQKQIDHQVFLAKIYQRELMKFGYDATEALGIGTQLVTGDLSRLQDFVSKDYVVPHDYVVDEEVSYGFNGDWYPDGKVEKVTACRMTTTGGHKYSIKTISWRVMLTDEVGRIFDTYDCRKEVFTSVLGGTWALAKGTIREWNPSF